MHERDHHAGTVAGLQIESIRPEEIDRILAIERESFSVPWTRKMFEAEVTGNPFGRVDVARMPGAAGELRLIGFICYWVVFDELHLLNVAVEPAYRRLGVARRLVSHALAFGAARGARRALLEVRISNRAAQGLYARFAFRETGTRPKYYTNPVEDARLLDLEPIQEQAEVMAAAWGNEGLTGTSG